MFKKCIDCKDRHVGCHSSCDAYLRSRALLNEINARIRQDKQLEQGLLEQKRQVHKISERRKRKP